MNARISTSDAGASSASAEQPVTEMSSQEKAVHCQRQDGFGPCEREAVRPITVGCVHEHLRTVRVCQPCFDITSRSEQGCVPCWNSGHWCGLRVTA